MNRFEDVKASLLASLNPNTGEILGAVRHRVHFEELRMFSPAEIKEIRLNAKMTQGMFAGVIGVSQKAVEAWEGGRTKPDGAARRTIGLLQKNPKYAEDVGILIRN